MSDHALPKFFWPCPHGCMTWCRDDIRFVDGVFKPMTNHHPRCEYVNASLIDVWKVSDGSSYYFTDNRAAAAAEAAAGEGITITADRMHAEIYNNLPEFDGF